MRAYYEGEKMQYDDVLKKLKSLLNPKAVEGMAKYGITPDSTYGVSIPNLRKIAKEIGTNRELAQKLWESNSRETRILACMINDPKVITEKQMERWAEDFNYWEICDQCCQNLFENSKFAYQKCVEQSSNEREFVKRAGFVLMARLAFKDKKAENKQFEEFLPIIKRKASDNRTYVKKAVNWALRQIGKRNLHLNDAANKIAKEIQQIDSRDAKWIASDAL
jgi:3-methyladenine DNA glycosylase AlkD